MRFLSFQQKQEVVEGQVLGGQWQMSFGQANPGYPSSSVLFLFPSLLDHTQHTNASSCFHSLGNSIFIPLMIPARIPEVILTFLILLFHIHQAAPGPVHSVSEIPFKSFLSSLSWLPLFLIILSSPLARAKLLKFYKLSPDHWLIFSYENMITWSPPHILSKRWLEVCLPKDRSQTRLFIILSALPVHPSATCPSLHRHSSPTLLQSPNPAWPFPLLDRIMW